MRSPYPGNRVANASAALPAAAGQTALALRDIHPIAFAGLAYAAAALLLFPPTFASVLLINAKQMLLTAPPGLAVLLFAIVIARRAKAPLAAMKRLAYERRFPLVATALLLLIIVSAFTTFKINIPNMVPFYADPMLARIDILIHGQEPWRLAHQLPAIAGEIIDFTYSRLWFALVLGNAFVVALIADRAGFLRYFATTVLTLFIGGTVVATLSSSVGPIFYQNFYDGTAFSDLDDVMRSNPYIDHVPAYAEYLLKSYRSKAVILGTGISAMPSMHVALTVLIAWHFSSYGRMAGVLGWALAIFVAFGAVYTGWHYAVDGYVGAAVSTVAWFVTSRHYGLPVFGRKRLQKPTA